MLNRENYYCLILAGGYSNHFWPLTRESKPKQFLQFPSAELSFLKSTYQRCLKLVDKEHILVVALEKHADLIRENIPEISEENILLEPYARNTAVCIAYASSVLLKRNPNAVMMVSPSDLLISDEELFSKTLTQSLQYAEQSDILITLGIQPNRPDPNFGYIQIAGGKSPLMQDKLIKVKTFTEKPDIEIAKLFCKSGEFYWNSGIFIWKASVIYEELEKYTPQIMSVFKNLIQYVGTIEEKAFIRRAYTDCTSLSIDYGVMEKTDRAWIYPVDFGWSDIDNWDSLFESYHIKDDNDNIKLADKLIQKDLKRSIVVGKNKSKLIAIKGLEDYMVIDTEDVLLICPREEKSYRELLAELGISNFEEYK